MLLRTGLSIIVEAMTPHDVKLTVVVKFALFGVKGLACFLYN